MTSFEHWKDWTFNGPLVGSAFELGKHHKSAIGPGSQHYLWIGGGAFRQEDPADDWYLQACLRFFLRGSPVGCLLFSDASAGAAATFTTPLRPIMRVKSDGSGSVQPTLRMQVTSNPAWARDNLDIGAFYCPLEADYLEMEVEDGKVSVAAGRIVMIRTGFRIVSF